MQKGLSVYAKSKCQDQIIQPNHRLSFVLRKYDSNSKTYLAGSQCPGQIAGTLLSGHALAKVPFCMFQIIF